MIWFYQEQKAEWDKLVPLGSKLPMFQEFKVKMTLHKVELPEDFEQNYFNPCIHALNRLVAEADGGGDWPYCPFMCEGRKMAIQGWRI